MKLRKSIVLSAVLLTSSAGFAGVKIGVIDVVKVIDQSPQMEQIKKDLKARFSDRQADIHKAQLALKKDLDKLNQESAVMDKNARHNLTEKVSSEQRDLAKKQVEFQHDVMAARDKSFAALVEKVKSSISKVAQQKHYDLVLTKQSVAFLNKESKFDLSNDVLDALK